MSTSNAIAITKASKNKNAASTLVQFLLSDEGQAMIGNSYVRIPGNENIAAKYSISNLLPHEAIVHFPDTYAYPRTQSDLNLLRDLFST